MQGFSLLYQGGCDVARRLAGQSRSPTTTPLDNPPAVPSTKARVWHSGGFGGLLRIATSCKSMLLHPIAKVWLCQPERIIHPAKILCGIFFALFILSACGGVDTTNVAICDANEDFAGDGTCLPYLTSAECQSLGFNGVDRRGDCIPFTQAECAYFFTDGKCLNLHTARALSHFDTEEYRASNTLENVRAAQAYVNIESLLTTDLSGTVTQGGGRQTISVVGKFEFNTEHQEFARDGVARAAFDSLYIAGADIFFANNALDMPIAKCYGNCLSNQYAGLVAASKDGVGMHGIAYNAQMRGIQINFNPSANILKRTIARGTGANIIAMLHVWRSTSSDINNCVSSADSSVTYKRPAGKNIGACPGSLTDSAPLAGDDLTVWEDALSDNNKTIMVFNSGGDGFNSETGIVHGTGTSPVTFTGSAKAANIPRYYPAYPALFDDDEVKPGKWLIVVGVDENNIIRENANGCGYALHFCLAAPVQDLYVPGRSESTTDEYETVANERYNSSATVTGALAVLKGAFPKATSEQLTNLILDTSTYLPLTDEAADKALVHMVDKKDGSGKRKINEVYGYGIMNLDAATKPSVRGSYVTASNNESIGALWQDTKLTLSSHFGTGLDSVKLGIGDEYGRHFTVKANKITSAPVAVASLDEYMANILADNVQSETLGGQAKLNYSNTAQPWMNLQYTSGKATSKIAFQDNYKISPLNDSGATSILRANNIRPASNNIGMMDVDYALNGALSLSSYAARGEYDTGYKFDELGTDFDVNYKKSHLNIAIGNIREHDQFLGTHTTGGYALNAPTVSRFTDVTYGHDVGNRFNIYANYINYETDVDMLHDQFASIDNLQADQYQIGFTGKNLMSDDDNLNVALITKLGVTDGALNQNTTLGYTADGGFNDVSQSYDLAVSERHQQFEITYQGKIYQNSQDGVSVLKDNRFFTTIRVDQNLNHEEGASQTEIVSGVSARF